MKRSLAWSRLIGVVTVAFFALALGAALAAEPASLSGDELRKAISGKTVYLNISGFELPIRYSASGRMSGKMSMIAASLSRGDGSSDTGKWWVGNDQLCQRWSSWMDGKTYCYKLTPLWHCAYRRLIANFARRVAVALAPRGKASQW
jgi:hypothetical protein